MVSQLRPAIAAFLILTILTGVVYPLAITLVAQTIFPEQANGSLIREGDRVVGSSLIGQPFAAPKYFQGRPSATSPTAYNASASGGSNLGPLNPALHDVIKARVDALKKDVPAIEKVPADLVTTSASGLDPHISPASAELQVARVARARGIKEEQVRELVRAHTEGRTFGVLGEPRVNVLQLNLGLDSLGAK